MLLYVYKTWPQDGFVGWTVEEFIQKTVFLSFAPGGGGEMRVEDSRLQDLKLILKHGSRLALTLGWEGDMRPGYPMISLLPEDNDGVATVIVWKQDNDGTSFVVSTAPLSWLEGQGEHVIREIQR